MMCDVAVGLGLSKKLEREKRTSSGPVSSERARGFLSLTRPFARLFKPGQARKTAGRNTKGNFRRIIWDNILFSVCLLEHMQIFPR